MPQTLTILPWDRPLLARAVAHLAAGWERGALDLSDRMIVVPTRQAGRRLREALAVHAAARGGAVLAPRVIGPEQVLELAMPRGVVVASRAQVLLAWIDTLRRADLAAFPEVFPVEPPDRGFNWALRLAGGMARLQAALAEGGLRFGDVVARAGADFEDARRWTQLARLEATVEARLAAQGVVTLQAASIAAAAAPAEPPDGVRAVTVLAVADPLPLALRVLEKWSHHVDVEVLAFGPAGEPALFDPWGRPQPEIWRERRLDLGEFERTVQLCADPAAQAAAIAARVEAAGADGGCATGAADPEVMPLLAGELRARGIACHLPEGRALAGEALAGLLQALRAASQTDDWASAVALARRTEVLQFLGAAGAGSSAARFLAALDALQGEHLPPTLSEARRHCDGLESQYPGIGDGLARLAELIGELRGGEFPAAWMAVLARLHSDRTLDLARADDRAFAETAEAWRAAAEEVAAADVGGVLAADEAGELARQLFAVGRLFDDKPAGAVELDGWLELVFRDEPLLLVAGLNEGCVPEAVAGHAFLPESLRERLGLKSNAQRFARDAWQLAALAAGRVADGGLALFLGKTTAAGEPLRPSRLLFQCADTELPARVRGLFRELPPEAGSVAWQRAWRWRVPWVGAPARLRVTGVRDYLACPFRFYLRHALKMEPVDAGKRELDARDFGTLVHRVLERLGQDSAWRDCTEAEELARAFDGALTAIVAARFGPELSVPLLVQVEAARQRLAAVARLQAAERAAGWVVDRTEWKLPAGRLSLGGIELSGTIDRIERHEATGRWRVLDYKTSETAKAPVRAHLRPERGGRAWLPAARVERGGQAQCWTDLQLPLYRWAVGEVLGAREVELGYFNLPKAVTETAIALWEDFDDGLQAAALRCAEAVGAGVRAGRFWPPAEEPENDNFVALVHGGAAASFDVDHWPASAKAEDGGAPPPKGGVP